MGAYYKKFVDTKLVLPSTLTIEQGHEINKDGKVYVHIKGEEEKLAISISGKAVYVKDIEVDIES